MGRKSLDDILKEFQGKLSTEVNNSSNYSDYDSGEKFYTNTLPRMNDVDGESFDWNRTSEGSGGFSGDNQNPDSRVLRQTQSAIGGIPDNSEGPGGITGDMDKPGGRIPKTDYPSGERQYEKPKLFTFSDEIRRKVVESITSTFSYVLDIWKQNQPTSRRGRGGDGGVKTESGVKYNIS